MKTAGWIPPALAAVALFFNGCATAKVWEADHFAKFSEPAPDANLQLFLSAHAKDILTRSNQ